MGLLAQKWARDWAVEDRNRREYDQLANQEKIKNLVGAQGFEQSGPMPMQKNGLLEQRAMIGGEGLLGGKGMFDQGNRGNFVTGLMSVPGYENIGANMLQNMYNEKQKTSQFAQKLNQVQSAKNQWTPKDILSMTTSQQTQFNKENAGYRNTLVEFNNFNNMLKKSGGFENLTATDTYAAITSFAKTLKPNEAVMADDVANVLALAGFENPLELAKNLATGKKLTQDQANQMYSIMESRAQEAMTRGGELRKLTGSRLEGTPIKPEQVMQSQVGFNPYEQSRNKKNASSSGTVNRFTPEQERFTQETGRLPASDGTIFAVPPGIPFEHPDFPGKYVTYDDEGNLREYD